MSETEQDRTDGAAPPPSSVLSRLQSVTSHHASCLASVSTLAAASTSSSSSNNGGGNSKSNSKTNSRPHSALAAISNRRSKCPQPPLAVVEPSASKPLHDALVMDLDLNPPERVPPHRIVPGLAARSTVSGGYAATAAAANAAATPLEDGESPATFHARKAIAALAALCDEASELNVLAERRILPPLALFANDLKRPADGTDELDEAAMRVRDAELLRRIGLFVPALQETFNFTLRCRRLVRNMVCQICGCASTNEEPSSSSACILGPRVRLVPIAKGIAKLLRVLIAVDAIVARNGCLNEGWELYKSIMRDRAVQLQTEGKRDDQLESHERLLVQLDFTLLSCRSFVTAIEQNFDPTGAYCRDVAVDQASPARAKKGSVASPEEFSLCSEIKAHVVELYDRCCQKIGTVDEADEANLAVGVYGMYCLYRRMLPSHLIPDGKLHRSLWMELPSRRPVVPLYADAAFVAREFLSRYAPHEGLRGCTPSVTSDPEELRKIAAIAAVSEASDLSSKTEILRADALCWMAAADLDLAPNPSSISLSGSSGDSERKEEPIVSIEKTIAQIVKGIRLARRASITIKNYLVSHSSLDIAISQENSLYVLCEVIKGIEQLLRVRRRASVVCVQRAAQKLYAASLYRAFESLRLATDHFHASVDHEKTASPTTIARITASLSSLEGVLKGSSTFSQARLDTVAIAVACCSGSSQDFHFDALTNATVLLEELALISEVDTRLRGFCDLSFLYFYKELFVDFARLFYASKNQGGNSSFQLVCTAFSDANQELLLLSPPERSDGQQSADDYRDFMLSVIQEEIVVPVCQVIDTQLRFAAFARSLQQQKQNNPKLDGSTRIHQFLDVGTLYACGASVDIRKDVEGYLESMFYVMSATSLQDNTTNSEMKAIAFQYGLNLSDDCLPCGSDETGSDLLQILKNLSDIGQRYSYDMNSGVLIEKRPADGTNRIATIDSHELASSLQQHGLGIVTHGTKIAYALLWKKFESLSQLFLNHDQLVSFLSKESRWYRENGADYGGAYPFSRAADFTEEISQLSKESDVALLHQITSIVTQIGNILAFVRMLSLAEAVHSNKSVAATSNPNLEAVKMQKTIPSSAAIEDATWSTNIALQRQHCCSTPSMASRRKKEYRHMQNFAVLIPALCLSWLEASLRGKEMIHKQNQTADAYFVDDGFALGLAFVLSTYGLDSSFDALKWFSAVRHKQANDEKSLNETTAAQNERDRQAQLNKTSSIFPFSRTVAAKVETSQEGEESTIDDEGRSALAAALSHEWRLFESRKHEMQSLFYALECFRALMKSR